MTGRRGGRIPGARHAWRRWRTRAMGSTTDSRAYRFRLTEGALGPPPTLGEAEAVQAYRRVATVVCRAVAERLALVGSSFSTRTVGTRATGNSLNGRTLRSRLALRAPLPAPRPSTRQRIGNRLNGGLAAPDGPGGTVVSTRTFATPGVLATGSTGADCVKSELNIRFRAGSVSRQYSAASPKSQPLLRRQSRCWLREPRSRLPELLRPCPRYLDRFGFYRSNCWLYPQCQ